MYRVTNVSTRNKAQLKLSASCLPGTEKTGPEELTQDIQSQLGQKTSGAGMKLPRARLCSAALLLAWLAGATPGLGGLGLTAVKRAV